MTIRTLGDKLAIRPLPGAGMIGRIHIPDMEKSTKNQTFHRAIVLAAGPKCALAKVGDTILCSEYFGDECRLDEKVIRIGRERDIVGVCA